jgi:hypothetical protein
MTQPDGIRRYLDDNGSTYTTEAIRKSLLEAGYAEADVNAALVEWRAARSGSEADQHTFRRWAVWFHLGALVVMVLVIVVLKGTDNSGSLLLGAAVLGVALLIGWWLSSLVGGALLPRTGVTVALIAPLISALVLGGTCIGLMNAIIGTPPLHGTADLEISSPEAFSGSAPASCYTYGSGFVSTVVSDPLGEIDGMTVTVSINPTPDEVAFTLYVELTNAEAGGYRGYSNTADTDLQVEASSNGANGHAWFSNLQVSDGMNPTGETFEPLAGEVSWTCEEN